MKSVTQEPIDFIIDTDFDLLGNLASSNIQKKSNYLGKQIRGKTLTCVVSQKSEKGIYRFYE